MSDDALVATREISLDGAAEIVRTQLELDLAPGASKAAFDALLARIGARVVSSVKGVDLPTVRIPDPGSLAALEALGPDGILVNISRGSVVDEDALIAALQEGRIAGAGLDVFEHEPVVPEALRALENVVLMPHRGGGTLETWADVTDVIREVLGDFFGGRPVRYRVA